MISALALGVILSVFKPPWAKLSLPPFVDFRRYWVHILIVFAIYNAKDADPVDRLLMASTGPT